MVASKICDPFSVAAYLQAEHRKSAIPQVFNCAMQRQKQDQTLNDKAPLHTEICHNPDYADTQNGNIKLSRLPCLSVESPKPRSRADPTNPTRRRCTEQQAASLLVRTSVRDIANIDSSNTRA